METKKAQQVDQMALWIASHLPHPMTRETLLKDDVYHVFWTGIDCATLPSTSVFKLFDSTDNRSRGKPQATPMRTRVGIPDYRID